MGSGTDRAKLKGIILDLFKDFEEISYYDILYHIDDNWKLVLELCKELENEKKIEAVDTHSAYRRL